MYVASLLICTSDNIVYKNTPHLRAISQVHTVNSHRRPYDPNTRLIPGN